MLALALCACPSKPDLHCPMGGPLLYLLHEPGWVLLWVSVSDLLKWDLCWNLFLGIVSQYDRLTTVPSIINAQ